jgi:hypothetical protein
VNKASAHWAPASICLARGINSKWSSFLFDPKLPRRLKWSPPRSCRNSQAKLPSGAKTDRPQLSQVLSQTHDHNPPTDACRPRLEQPDDHFRPKLAAARASTWAQRFQRQPQIQEKTRAGATLPLTRKPLQLLCLARYRHRPQT